MGSHRDVAILADDVDIVVGGMRDDIDLGVSDDGAAGGAFCSHVARHSLAQIFCKAGRQAIEYSAAAGGGA